VPPRQFAGGDAWIGHLINNIVYLAAEGIKRRDGGAALGGKKKKGVIKAAA
jgi:hypothetical protein